VEYRGIRYTVRVRIEREQWYVAIHPAGVEMNERVVSGSREQAELQARAMIDSWLKNRSTLGGRIAANVAKLPELGAQELHAVNSHHKKLR
jgi:hypothetical protein